MVVDFLVNLLQQMGLSPEASMNATLTILGAFLAGLWQLLVWAFSSSRHPEQLGATAAQLVRLLEEWRRWGYSAEGRLSRCFDADIWYVQTPGWFTSLAISSQSGGSDPVALQGRFTATEKRAVGRAARAALDRLRAETRKNNRQSAQNAREERIARRQELEQMALDRLTQVE